MGEPQGEALDIGGILMSRVIGQPTAIKSIVPFIEMYRAGLAPEGRPAGIFLLLGPTGTGKTRTVEVLADILHGSEQSVLKINCGEFQLEHEVAKLVGAPPGYTGHRETQPLLSQKALANVTSERCKLSLVLFDEIEKASPSMGRLLLGMMDRAQLNLGDGTTVDFTNSLVFFTSNLGGRAMTRESEPAFGFEAGTEYDTEVSGSRLESIALSAVKKHFSPEFVNRIDAVITFMALSPEALSSILDQQIGQLQQHVNTRLGDRCFRIEVTPSAREYLLGKGTSAEYGARELRRTIHRSLTQPLATLVAEGKIAAGSTVRADTDPDGEKVNFTFVQAPPPPRPAETPMVLLVDDNHDLATFLTVVMRDRGWNVVAAENARDARTAAQEHGFAAAIVDYMLPDDNGVYLALELRKTIPTLELLVVMTGGNLSNDDAAVCEAANMSVLQKPFAPQVLLSLLRDRVRPSPLSNSAGAS